VCNTGVAGVSKQSFSLQISQNPHKTAGVARVARVALLFPFFKRKNNYTYLIYNN
jgi:hypothetical protein